MKKFVVIVLCFTSSNIFSLEQFEILDYLQQEKHNVGEYLPENCEEWDRCNTYNQGYFDALYNIEWYILINL